MDNDELSPLLRDKATDEPSVFRPEALIREARRQKGLASAPVPPVCVLDPDGDIVRHLRRSGLTERSRTWPCYHSELDIFPLAGRQIGIVGCAVGAPYAVLVAEQMFALGCGLLISITSAGQIVPVGPPPYFVVIDRALRDEGTSHHYLPPAAFAEADPALIADAVQALRRAQVPIQVGSTWTTDAPFRETSRAIEDARSHGVLGVEMEAAALYAFAAAHQRRIVCLAHVTNQMGRDGEDFEKGEAGGAGEALHVIEALASSVPTTRSGRTGRAGRGGRGPAFRPSARWR
ncbi:MAG: uridine phosphorylase [Streptosporangiales bacterium]|nr:uridine phosphorylase [Streptosporangiales bacterium]